MGAGPSRASGSAPTAPAVKSLEATKENVSTFVQEVKGLSTSMLGEAERQTVAGLIKQATGLLKSIEQADAKPNLKGKQPKIDFPELFTQLRQQLANIKHALPKPALQHVAPPHLPTLRVGLRRAATIAALQEATTTKDEEGDSTKLSEVYLGKIDNALGLRLDRTEKQTGFTLDEGFFSEQINTAKAAIQAPGATKDSMLDAVNTFERTLDAILKNDLGVELVRSVSFREQLPQYAFNRPPKAVENFFKGAGFPSSPVHVDGSQLGTQGFGEEWTAAAVAKLQEADPQSTPAGQPLTQAGLNTIQLWRAQCNAYSGHQEEEADFSYLQQIDDSFNETTETITNFHDNLGTIQTALEALEQILPVLLPGIQLTPIQLPTAPPSQPIPIPVSSLRNRLPDRAEEA